MKLFFEICKEFFDLLYLPYITDIIENEIIREELDEEQCYQEVSSIENIQYYEQKQDYDYIQNDEQKNNQLIQDIHYNQEKKDIESNNKEEDDKEFCGCEFFRQTLSIINTKIYKLVNNNKSE